MKAIKIGDRWIGQDFPPYIIAEIGSNHNGDMELCKKLIDAAKECGVDVAKFQSFDTECLISKTLYDKRPGSFYKSVKKYQLTPQQHKEISKYCKKKGIVFASTPLSSEFVDLLDLLEVPFFKVASMDITNHSLLEYIGSKGKPVILSTGMASLWEIDQAMEIFRKAKVEVVLLHCVTLYPPRYNIVNLRNIEMLKNAFGVPVGFSDHTSGTSVAMAAIALGTCILEKHFTLDKNMPGWDHAISADPAEMKYIVEEAKNVFASLGTYEKIIGKDEIKKRNELRRSIVASRNLKKGKKITIGDLKFKRPEEGGVSPAKHKDIIGRTLKKDVSFDHQITLRDLI